MNKKMQIRNSTTDFLVFTKDSRSGDSIEVRVQDGNVWLTQKAIGQLFDIERSVVTKHLQNVFASGELEENSTCANFAQVAADGKTYRVIQGCLYKSDFDHLIEESNTLPDGKKGESEQ